MCWRFLTYRLKAAKPSFSDFNFNELFVLYLVTALIIMWGFTKAEQFIHTYETIEIIETGSKPDFLVFPGMVFREDQSSSELWSPV